MGDHKTSMLQDLERDRPLELDVILAVLIELAELTHTPAPTLRAVHALTDLLASKVGAGAGPVTAAMPAPPPEGSPQALAPS